MYAVRIADIQELQKIHNNWNNLVSLMKLPSIFCTWEWMSLWWKHYGKDYSPLVLLIYNGKEDIIGILPLALRTMFIEDGVIPVRTLVFWSSIELYPDHQDIIAAQADAEPCMEASLSFLRKDFTNWDILYFSHINNESFIFSFFMNADCSVSNSIQQVSVAPFIANAEDYRLEFENYVKSLGRNRRHDVKRRTKILLDKSEITYLKSEPEAIDNDIKKLFILHSRRAMSKNLTTFFSGQRLIDFHTELANMLTQKNWLRLRFLNDDGNSIAAIYIFSFANRWIAYQSGLDPKWEAKGAGNVLLNLAIKESFDEGMREFDFLRGGEEYKNTWTNRRRDLFDVRVFNATIRGSLFKRIYRARLLLKKIILNKYESETVEKIRDILRGTLRNIFNRLIIIYYINMLSDIMLV